MSNVDAIIKERKRRQLRALDRLRGRRIVWVEVSDDVGPDGEHCEGLTIKTDDGAIVTCRTQDSEGWASWLEWGIAKSA